MPDCSIRYATQSNKSSDFGRNTHVSVFCGITSGREFNSPRLHHFAHFVSFAVQAHPHSAKKDRYVIRRRGVPRSFMRSGTTLCTTYTSSKAKKITVHIPALHWIYANASPSITRERCTTRTRSAHIRSHGIVDSRTKNEHTSLRSISNQALDMHL